MAETDFGALATAQKRAWSAKLWAEGRDASLIMSSGMIGTGANRPVQLITDLTNDGRGDKCVMSLVQDLAGDGTAGDNTLDGNEETMVNETLEIKLDQLRHGVKNKGKMSDQRTIIRFRSVAKEHLGFWFGNKIDEIAFLTLAGMSYTLNLNGSARSTATLSQLAWAADVTAPSANRKFYCGTATSTGSLTTADKVTWNDLVRLRAMAEDKRIKPIRDRGKDRYIVLLSTFAGRDLKLDDDYKTAVTQGQTRGDANPMFTGAFADVDGMLIYTHKKVPTTRGIASGSKYGSGGTVEGAQCLLLGAQALAFARIGEPEWEEDPKDYKNKIGLAHGQIMGFRKPVWTSEPDGRTTEDFSVVSAYCAAAA